MFVSLVTSSKPIHERPSYLVSREDMERDTGIRIVFTKSHNQPYHAVLNQVVQHDVRR